jgi:hypothetical protein
MNEEIQFMNKNRGLSSVFLRKRALIVFIVLIILPLSLMANGAKNSDEEYEVQLQAMTEQICTSLELKEMTANEAKLQLDELRKQYKKEYTDGSGIMDSIIDGLANGEMTGEQARVRIRELEELRLQLRESEELQRQERKREERLLEEQKREERQTQTQTQTQNNDSSENKPAPSPSPNPTPKPKPKSNRSGNGG